MSVVEAPFGFLEVNEEPFLSDPAKFRHAKLRKTPEGFDAIDVVLSASEFISMMVDPVVSEAVSDKSVVSLPAVGVNVATFDNSTLENRHQFCLGAVFDHAHEYPPLAFMKAQNRRFSTGSAPSFAANPLGSEIAFIDLDIANKGARLLKRQVNDALPQKEINALSCFAVQTGQNGCREGWNIHTEALQNLPKFDLGNMWLFLILVLQ